MGYDSSAYKICVVSVVIHMCVYMYVCMYVCMDVCMGGRMTDVCMRACRGLCVSMHVCMYINIATFFRCHHVRIYHCTQTYYLNGLDPKQ